MCNWNTMGKFSDLIALSLVSLVLEITGSRDIMLRVLSLLTQFLMSSGKRLRTVTAYKLQAEEVKGLEVNSNARERNVDEEAWVEQTPTNMRELLEIGLLQGLQVFYNFVHKVTLTVGMSTGQTRSLSYVNSFRISAVVDRLLVTSMDAYSRRHPPWFQINFEHEE